MRVLLLIVLITACVVTADVVQDNVLDPSGGSPRASTGKTTGKPTATTRKPTATTGKPTATTRKTTGRQTTTKRGYVYCYQCGVGGPACPKPFRGAGVPYFQSNSGFCYVSGFILTLTHFIKVNLTYFYLSAINKTNISQKLCYYLLHINYLYQYRIYMHNRSQLCSSVTYDKIFGKYTSSLSTLFSYLAIILICTH